MEEDIKRCKELIKAEHSNWIGISNQKAIENILVRNEEQEKMIELMAYKVSHYVLLEDEINIRPASTEEIIEYFKKKAREEK